MENEGLQILGIISRSEFNPCDSSKIHFATKLISPTDVYATHRFSASRINHFWMCFHYLQHTHFGLLFYSNLYVTGQVKLINLRVGKNPWSNQTKLQTGNMSPLCNYAKWISTPCFTIPSGGTSFIPRQTFQRVLNKENLNQAKSCKNIWLLIFMS